MSSSAEEASSDSGRIRGTSPVGGSVQCGRSAAGGVGSPAPVVVPRDVGATGGGLGTAVDGSLSSASGKLTCGRGPSGEGGTSPNRGSSSGRLPAACPVSMATCASSAPMMRTPSVGARGVCRTSISSSSSTSRSPT